MSEPSSELDAVAKLAESFLARYRKGERPSLSEYTDRHPELASQIRDLFPALVAMEELGSVEGPRTGPDVAAGAERGPLPEQLGDYRILRQVGQGGMGVVYEAVQESLGRHVALKVLPSHGLLSPTHLERFRREARAAARLHHTNIVPVFGVGEDRGVHYYAMQFIQGQGLDEVLKELRRLRLQKAPTAAAEPAGDQGDVSLAQGLLTGRFSGNEVPAREGEAPAEPAAPGAAGASPSLSRSSATDAFPNPASGTTLTAQPEGRYFRGVAQMGAQVAEALEYAHKQGILHRDIKPSNLLLDAAGTVWVTDFGLAKASPGGDAAEDDLTHTGDIVGTLRYMAPERFNAQADSRSDVYGLGVTLYELITLQPAFQDTSRPRLIERVLHDDPPRPRKLEPHVPRDLETIVLKAIEKEPGRRYQSARGLADDLRRFLAGEPIKARRIGVWERGAKWARRRPAVAALLAVSAAALLTLVIGSLVHNALLSAALVDARQAEREKTRQLAVSYFKEAQAKRFSGRAGRRFESLELLKKAAAIYESLGELTEEKKLELRNEAIACLALVDIKKGQEWELEPDWNVGGLRFDDTQQYCAVPTTRTSSSENAQGYVSVRRVTDHQEIVRLPGPADYCWSEFSPDCRYLMVSYGSHLNWQFWVWDLQGGEPVWKLPAGVSTGARFSPDSRTLAFFHHTSREIVLYETTSAKIQKRLAADSNVFFFSPDGRRLAVANSQKPYQVRIVNLDREEAISLPHPAFIRYLAWRGDGRLLAAACAADERNQFHAYVWDLDSPTEPRAVLKGHQAEIDQVAFNHGGNLLVTLSWDSTMRLWDPLTGRQLLSATAPTIPYPRFSLDDRQLAHGGASQKVWFWDVATGREFRTFHGHTGRKQPHGVDTSPDGRLMASSDDGGIRLWDPAAVREWDKPVGLLAVGHSASVMFDPGGDNLITAGRGAGLQRWPMVREANGLRVGPPESIGSSARAPLKVSYGCGALSLDGRTVGFVPSANSGLVFDLKDPTRRTALLGHHLEQVRISPDGKWVAGHGWNTKGTPVWDAHTGKLVKLLPQPDRSYPCFSPDGRWLTLLMASGEARFYEVGTWQPAHAVKPKEPNSQAFLLAFSPDGTMAAVRHGPFNVIQLIDPATAREYATLEPPDPQQNLVMSFSPDGSQLAVACETGVVQVWDLRLIRQQLAEMGLDWNLPTYQPTPAGGRGQGEGGPLRVEVVKADPPPPSKELDAEAHFERGLLYAQLHQWQHAVNDFHQAHKLNPQLRPWEEVLRVCSEAIERNSKDAGAYHHRAHTHERLGHWQDAIADHSKAIELNPQNLSWRVCRAKAYLRMGQKDKAAEDLRKAGELKPKEANHLAWELATSPNVLLRDPGLAVELAQQAVRQAPKECIYWNTLGVAHNRSGEWDAAIKALEEAEKLAPGKHFAFNAFFLAMCHHQLGDSAKAKDYYDRAVRWCQENQGKLSAARQQELKAFQAEAEALLTAPQLGS